MGGHSAFSSGSVDEDPSVITQDWLVQPVRDRCRHYCIPSHRVGTQTSGALKELGGTYNRPENSRNLLKEELETIKKIILTKFKKYISVLSTHQK